MSFFNFYPESNLNEQVIVQNAILNDFILEEDIVSSIPFVDNVAPILVYDMVKYLDDSFYNKSSFYQSNCNTYEEFLYQTVIEKCKLYTKLDLNTDESHILFLHSTFKKMYILNNELNVFDYYILD
jgi:hypothetical protein